MCKDGTKFEGRHGVRSDESVLQFVSMGSDAVEYSARMSSVGRGARREANEIEWMGRAKCARNPRRRQGSFQSFVPSKPAPTYAALFEKRSNNKVVDGLGQLSGIVETLQSQSHAVWG